jgi:ferritin-like metal-binding protein YciE
MTNRLFKRFREAEPATEGAAGNAKSPREALNEQWLRIRAGLGGSDAIDSMDAVYRAELRDLRSAERQACALVDEIWVTLLNAPLAERVSQYVATLRRRTAEYEGETHRNAIMRALVNETSRVAENCATSVRDVVLVATLQHMVHYLIASYGTIAAHAQALGLAEQAALFDGYAEADRQFDLDLSSLARNEVNPQALGPARTAPLSESQRAGGTGTVS